MTIRDWIADLNRDLEEQGLTWSREHMELIIKRVEGDAEEAERAFFHIQDQRERLKKMLQCYRNIRNIWRFLGHEEVSSVQAR